MVLCDGQLVVLSTSPPSITITATPCLHALPPLVALMPLAAKPPLVALPHVTAMPPLVALPPFIAKPTHIALPTLTALPTLFASHHLSIGAFLKTQKHKDRWLFNIKIHLSNPKANPILRFWHMDVSDVQPPSPVVFRYVGTYPWHIFDLMLYLKSFKLNNAKRILLFKGRSGKLPQCHWIVLTISLTAWEWVAKVHLLRYLDLNQTVDSLKRKFKELHKKISADIGIYLHISARYLVMPADTWSHQ